MSDCKSSFSINDVESFGLNVNRVVYSSFFFIMLYDFRYQAPPFSCACVEKLGRAWGRDSFMIVDMQKNHGQEFGCGQPF